MEMLQRDKQTQRPWSSRVFLAGALLAIILAAVLLAGCGLSADQPTVGLLEPTSTTAPTATPSPVQLVQQTVIQFCQAMSDGKLSQAYSYLSAHYKRTVTSASQLPYQLPRWGKIVGCHEFGNGGFIQGSGDHGTDSAEFNMTGGPFGTTTINGTIGLVLVGSICQVDSIGM